MVPAEAPPRPTASLATVTAPLGNAPQKIQEAVADAGTKAKATIAESPWLWANAVAAAIILTVLWRKRFFRSQGLSRGRSADQHPWYLWFACAAMVWLSSTVAVGAGASIQGITLAQMAGSLKAQSILHLCGYGASLIVGFVLVRLVRISAPDAGLSTNPRRIGTGLLAFVVSWPLVASVGLLAVLLHRTVTGESPGAIAHDTLKSLVENPGNPWAWTLAGLAVIAAPIQEEIIYRAFGQSAMLAASGRPWIAVLTTSALFAGVHAVGPQPVPWYAAVAIFALAVCMGAAFERTKSLMVPIVMHVLFNAANVAMAVLS